MEKQSTSSYDRISQSISSSITLKMIVIGFLILVLLIPLALIQETINERAFRKDEVIREISQSWSGNQIIKGPILTIPYTTKVVINDSDGKTKTRFYEKQFQILPESLNIIGPIRHDTRSRGIYEITVYDTELNISGDFILPNIEVNDLHKIHWSKAYLTVGISDMKGIKEEVRFVFDEKLKNVEPGTRINHLIPTGITANADINPNTKSYNFDILLNIKGSGSLQFLPLGKTTQVNIESKWPDPSFKGEYLPADRIVTDTGFSASWKVLHLNRNYPQYWPNDAYDSSTLNATAFGVELFTNTDNYQVVSRASKYGIMTIALTFLAFFLVEIMNKVKIHPMQYILVGLGLVIFYVLLVSITEHSGFILAYITGSSSIILIIFLYALAIFQDRRLAFGLLTVLIAVYTFVFVTLRLEDYALLIGSIGLTVILALTMYLTRNINWFTIGKGELSPTE